MPQWWRDGSGVRAAIFNEALASCQRSAALAKKAHDDSREARALIGISAFATRLRRYSLAIESGLDGERLALTAKDIELAGAAAVNISAVLDQLGDFDRARQEDRKAVGYLKDFRQQRLLRSRVTSALLCWTTIRETIRKRKPPLIGPFVTSQAAADPQLEALAWDERGSLLLDEEAETPRPALLRSAQEPLNKAYEIRLKLKDEPEAAVSKEHLAEFELIKPNGDYHLALKLINEVLASPESSISRRSSLLSHPYQSQNPAKTERAHGPGGIPPCGKHRLSVAQPRHSPAKPPTPRL